jgi:hypothetical protein
MPLLQSAVRQYLSGKNTNEDKEVKDEDPNIVDDFIELLREHFAANYTTEEPCKILIVTHNGVDGIGDYIHMIDFGIIINQFIAQTGFPISLQALSFVHSERVGFAKIVTNGKIKPENIVTFDQKDAAFDTSIYQKPYIIWSGWAEGDGPSHFDELKHFIQSHMSIMNLSYGSGRVMRFHDMSGITEADKQTVMALSTINASSGDSSYSETVNAGRLPYFHTRGWKKIYRFIFLMLLS